MWRAVHLSSLSSIISSVCIFPHFKGLRPMVFVVDDALLYCLALSFIGCVDE